MGYNGSGVFTATGSTVNPAQDGTTISSTDFNALLDELEAALSSVICKDGQTTVTGTIPFSTITANGVKFPATQSPSSNANTLDDYEEGSWTPTVVGASTAGSQTYATQIGRYVKVGKVVNLTGFVQITAKGGTMAGVVNVGGLPFAAANVGSSIAYSLAVSWVLGGCDLSAGYTQVGLHVLDNDSNARLTELGDNVDAQEIAVGAIGASFGIKFSGWYLAAA